MKKLNIAVISGGSGNDALIKGIKKLYPNSNVNVLVNAYDSGKSTGICRKVTNTLGVSDIRKNHTRMYKALNKNPNENYLKFYDMRFDFSKGNEIQEICDYLDSWDLGKFKEYVKRFFLTNSSSSEFDYKDFSVANIVYSQMYKELGYEKTNSEFCKLLGLDDFVILNSFDNVYIHAHLQDGTVLTDEGDIVTLNNPNNKIVKLDYVGEHDNGINIKAINLIKNADLIIISTGTFWSSIYPTLEYLDFYKYINKAKGKKIWALNNKEDNDSYGVSSNDFINIVNKLGLDLTQFTILENLDATSSLREPNKNFDIVYRHMGNVNGKHDGDAYAEAIFMIYFGINEIKDLDNIIFDFDDTLWSRNKNKVETSINNIKLLQQSTKVKNKSLIITGGNYSEMNKKFNSNNINNFDLDIWADANSILYSNGKVVDKLEELKIKECDYIVDWLKLRYGIKAYLNEEKTCIKIKPLNNLERLLLRDIINHEVSNKGIEVKASITGKTTIDILHLGNSKLSVFNYLGLKNKKTLFIGDETVSGNDSEISPMCTYSIQVNNVDETNLIIKLLEKKLGE